ncbi:MAG TPA: RDD family protein [Sphingobacteriaceae bacterium]
MLVILFIISVLAFTTSVTEEINSDYFVILVMHAPVLLFFYFATKTSNWAKWTLSIILFLFASLHLLTGFDAEITMAKVTSMLLLFISLYIHISNPINIYLTESRNISIEPRQDQGNYDIEAPVNENDERLPSLSTRIKSVFIDFLVVLSVLCIYVVIMGDASSGSVALNLLIGFALLSYEPIFTAFGTTIGQSIMGINIKSNADRSKRIPVHKAYVRFIFKALLGWISYFTLFTTKGKRAMHDLMAGSIVLTNDK